jgi:DDE superfamily endonuclease
VVFQDETGFTLHPRLGRGWAKCGQRLRIATTSCHHARLNLSGWVAPLMGRRGMISVARGNRESFVQTLAHIYSRLRGYTIWLYVDRAGWHKGPPVEDFLRAHPRLHLDYLPPYQPALNPQERIWRQIRFEATTNRWFETLEQVRATIQKTTRSWSQRKIRRLYNIT